MCEEFHQVCKTFTLVYDYKASFMNTGLPVDEYSLEIYLTVTPDHTALDPVTVKADGNCLAYVVTPAAFTNVEINIVEKK